ncbi:ligand-binding protein SH3 [Paraburkholderia xenovorans]|uniref:ligand-binding protein SH3 n=1 Tax=Paraburkholderia xenovorans TaxID=36873 RepID=UPI0038B82D51
MSLFDWFPSVPMSFFFLLLSGTFSAMASILLRVAGKIVVVQGDVLIAGFASRPLLLRMAAIGAYGAGFLFYALALRRVELSVAYPLMVAVTILEILLFGFYSGEAVSLRTLAGAALLLASVLLLYLPAAAPARP